MQKQTVTLTVSFIYHLTFYHHSEVIFPVPDYIFLVLHQLLTSDIEYQFIKILLTAFTT